jgi:hypothetical protein
MKWLACPCSLPGTRPHAMMRRLGITRTKIELPIRTRRGIPPTPLDSCAMVSLPIILQNRRTFSITWSRMNRNGVTTPTTADSRLLVLLVRENMLVVGLQRNGPLRFVVTDDGDTGNLIMMGLHCAWAHMSKELDLQSYGKQSNGSAYCKNAGPALFYS